MGQRVLVDKVLYTKQVQYWALVAPKIKWWILNEENLKLQFTEALGGRRLLENVVQEWWEENSKYDIESWTGGARYDNRKEISRGQEDGGRTMR